jgi:metal-responsive CopG/Arc/MetJ family transcriptional regulator
MKKSHMHIITFKVDENTLLHLDEFAFSMALTRSEVIRRAILFYLKHNKPQANHPRVKIVEVV